MENENGGEKEDSWRIIAVSKVKFITLFPAEGDINDVLIKTLAEAHANTNIKLEAVHEMFRKPQVGLVRIASRSRKNFPLE